MQNDQNNSYVLLFFCFQASVVGVVAESCDVGFHCCGVWAFFIERAWISFISTSRAAFTMRCLSSNLFPSNCSETISITKLAPQLEKRVKLKIENWRWDVKIQKIEWMEFDGLVIVDFTLQMCQWLPGFTYKINQISDVIMHIKIRKVNLLIQSSHVLIHQS